MSETKNNKLEEYLYQEVSKRVDVLFEKLHEGNINVELERSELTEKELALYLEIYKDFEEQLIQLKEEAIAKFGYTTDFDYTFAIIIQELVTKKQEL